MLKNNILETIGNTPLVRLSRLEKLLGINGELYAKIEYYSPGLSKKDRIAKYMLDKAIDEGNLKKGQVVVEKTSGNTGIALAAVCAVYGFPFIAVMSKGNSKERVKMIESFNGKVVLVDQHEDSKPHSVTEKDLELVDKTYRKIINDLDAYGVDQFDNLDNPECHYYTTAEEIIADLPTLTGFVDYVGTGGTFAGISKKLKEYNNEIICAMVEPDKRDHIIQGGGYFKNIPFLDNEYSYKSIIVSEEEAIQGMNYLSGCEAICAGVSSGANLIGAIKLINENPNSKVVFLINDISLKYNSIIESKK